jgi:uncharacterized protein (DUF1800 family)
MRSVALAVMSALLIAGGVGTAAGRFDVELPADKQVVHVLNRLAFGPRPGDVQAVRLIGVEAWIRRQLDPDSIPDSSILAAKLAPLESLTLPTWQIFETYQFPQPQIRLMAPNLIQLLSPDQRRRLQSGTLEERRAVIDALTPALRQEVLAAAPPNLFDALPDHKHQAVRARQIQEEIRNREYQQAQQRLRPPLYELLTPEQARDLQRGTNDEKLAVLTAMNREQRTLVFRSLQPNTVPDEFRREALAASNPHQAVAAELIEAKLQRVVYSPRQLEEVLVDFWFNHFNVYSGKGAVGMLLTSYERDAIRPFVLGRFRDMVLATARHPAMLFYLDNWLSVDPGRAAGRKRGLNENYARELLELHTLGVDGGYTQDDIVHVARAFSGWTIGQDGAFRFARMQHDAGVKTVLGQRLPAGGGMKDGERVLDLVAAHPSTARHIATKLARRFVSDTPPEPLVARAAARFTATGGDLREVVRTIVTSPEFFAPDVRKAKVKTPLEFVVSAVRAENADVRPLVLVRALRQLGMPLYMCQPPTGYDDTADTWISPGALVTRINVAQQIAPGGADRIASPEFQRR